jgi:hypothetical protein
MVKGDPGVESIFLWTKDKKGVNRRGAGPMDGKRGAGEGYGVHICTGPVAIRGAEHLNVWLIVHYQTRSVMLASLIDQGMRRRAGARCGIP